MAERAAPPNDDGDVVMALAVPSDSDDGCEVEIVEVCMGVLVSADSDTTTMLPPDPPLARTGTDSWELVPACGKPIRRAGNPRAQCRWSELSCPWRHHAVWRHREGREVVTLQRCPEHPRCLVLLCRLCTSPPSPAQ